MSMLSWLKAWRAGRTLQVSWVRKGDTWQLAPTLITVRPTSGYWEIFLHESPTNFHYVNEGGAKRDALQMAQRKCLQYFGASRLHLVGAP